MGRLTEQQVFEAIQKEREYQRQKYGADKQQSLPGFLLVAQEELNEAIIGWNKNLAGRSSPLHELCQVAAVCFAAMEKYGVEGSAISTDDIPGY